MLASDDIQRDERFFLDNILSGRTFYRKPVLPSPLSDLSFYLTVLASGASGFAYHNGEPGYDAQILRLINRNALEVLSSETDLPHPLRVSLLDAVYELYNRVHGHKPQAIHVHSGSYAEQAAFRSKLVTDQVRPGSRVLLVGLVTRFVRDLQARRMQVSISDLSPELGDTVVYGIPVVNTSHDWTLAQLADCEAAIVTGACIATDTVDSICAVATQCNTELHFYLETGNNFGPELIRRGATSVIAEKFPFYDLPGPSQFEVFVR